jgi:hypothetical protein
VTAGVVGSLLLLLLPATALGPAATGRLLVAWQAYGFSPYLRPNVPTPFEEAETGYIPGHSVRATIHRLLRPIDASPHDDRIVHVNVLDLPWGVAEATYLVVTFLLLGIFVWTLWGRSRDGRFPLEYALGILFIFVLSPYVRKGHGTLLLIPFAVAIAAWRDPARSTQFRHWTAAALAGAFAFGSLTGRFALGVEGAALAASLSTFLWGNLILLAWALIALGTGGKTGSPALSGATSPSPAGDPRRPPGGDPPR